MTNCIKQITSCMIKNESQRRSCGIIEIIPPKHFIHISSTDVHTCSAHITPQECSCKQKGTCTRSQYPEGKPRFPVPHPDGTLPLQLEVHRLRGGKGRASCYSGRASLLPALLEMSSGSYTKYRHRTLLLSAAKHAMFELEGR